jgi:hypothetical protein
LSLAEKVNGNFRIERRTMTARVLQEFVLNRCREFASPVVVKSGVYLFASALPNGSGLRVASV